METVAVIDFETTGGAPGQGDRATEIGVVLLQGTKILGRYQSLMNPGVHIPQFIVNLTGITNEMVKKAPPARVVMKEAFDFVGYHPIVAHNAAFDRRFWDAEGDLIGRARIQPFLCTLLLARRVMPQAPSHKLSELVHWMGMGYKGKAHRAMADAEMAAGLFVQLAARIRRRGPPLLSAKLLEEAQKVPKGKFAQWLSSRGPERSERA